MQASKLDRCAARFNLGDALLATILLSIAAGVFARPCHAESPQVRVERTGNQWQLVRGNEPYFIRGVGGDSAWELLRRAGGNSVRTWGDDHLQDQLDRAQKLGLTVTAGIWLGQVRQGFDWTSAEQLLKQREHVLATVRRYKDHPALLVWALGNEMEDPEGANAAVWNEINALAKLVKSIDDRHPVMTVIAEIGGDKVRNVHAICPDIDILGINSYAGAASLAERYAKLGGTKPYVLTEFGPPGIWETQKDAIGAYPELSSSAKARWYQQAYRESVDNGKGQCLGSYAFLWGYKQEVTATWFSLLLPDQSRLSSVDTLSELWTGRAPSNRCPVIESLRFSIDGKPAESVMARPDENLQVMLVASDPEAESLKTSWQVFADSEEYGTGGDSEAAAAPVAGIIVRSDEKSAEIRAPKEGGLYRIFVTIRDGHGGAAVANLPLRVDAPKVIARGRQVALPLVVYDEGESTSGFIPSGWMGDTKAIALDHQSSVQPHAGKTCLRCEFKAASGWGGVVWQDPPGDWGDRRGGFDLSQAKRLIFFARGEKGGEEVSFGFGIIGKEKPYHDTGSSNLEKVRLTTEWKRYEIPVTGMKEGRDLTRIKTGFMWTAASSGAPIVFYLDQIQWE